MVLPPDGSGFKEHLSLECCSLLPIITSDQHVSKYLIDHTTLHRTSGQMISSTLITSYKKEFGGHLGSREES